MALVFSLVILIILKVGLIIMMNVHMDAAIGAKIEIHKIALYAAFRSVLLRDHRLSLNSDLNTKQFFSFSVGAQVLNNVQLVCEEKQTHSINIYIYIY